VRQNAAQHSDRDAWPAQQAHHRLWERRLAWRHTGQREPLEHKRESTYCRRGPEGAAPAQQSYPEPATNHLISYVVLGVSLVFEGTSWWIALREFRATKGAMGYFEAFRRSKDPSTFTVLLEDSAALLGLGFALIGLLAAQLLDMPILDGVASLCIAGVLAVTAFLLARETKGLLVGEPAHPSVAKRILAVATRDADLRRANGVTTMQMGPDQVVAMLSAEFEDDRTTPQIEACITRIEKAVKAEYPELVALFVKPQTPEVFQARKAALGNPHSPT